MQVYLNMLRDIMENGSEKTDRTGTGTISIFGYQMRFNLQKGFPLLTTKKMHTKSIIHELLWFIQGDTNVKYLQERGVTIWDEWANRDTGDLGPIYGKQWRNYTGHLTQIPQNIPAHTRYIGLGDRGSDGVRVEMDQLAWAINRIKTNPDCRRIIVNAWNPTEIPLMALAPCHALFQFYVSDGKLSCQLYQRSADAFLGVPFNISSYALLTHMVAKITNLEVGDFVHTFGDLHIYKNHFEQVKTQLSREPLELPRLNIADRGQKKIEDFVYEDFSVEGYVSHPAIKAPIAV